MVCLLTNTTIGEERLIFCFKYLSLTNSYFTFTIPNMKYKIFLVISLLINYKSFSQNLEINGFIKLLENDHSKQVFAAATVADTIGRYDTANIKFFVEQLVKATEKSSLRLQARVQGLKARLLFYKLGAGDSLYATLMKEALEKAYRLDDIYMIAEFSRWYGEMLNTNGDEAGAALYCMNSLKLQEEAGLQNFPSVKTFYMTTAEMLARTRNYREAIDYYTLAFKLKDTTTDKNFIANSMNTLGKCYHFFKKYDSSVYAYQQCMQYVKLSGAAEDWYYSASDNRYEPYLELKQYDSCKKIANDLYAAGQNPRDSMMLMSACHMYSRIAIRNNRFEEGLKWSLQSEQYAVNAKKFLIAVYYDIAYCYEKLGQNDKALPYFRLNKKMTDRRDSISGKATGAFLNAQSDFLKAQLRYKKLREENTSQLWVRNIIIGFGVLLSGVIIFYLLRRKRRTETAMQEAERKSAYFQDKYNNAEEQLNEFKNKIAGYTSKLDALQVELNKQSETKASTENIEAISKQIILTEKDWEVFKETFSTVYPGFFNVLKNQFPDITNAELRMAALMRLNFGIKHIASMLGISQNSVHKTRYRLRKRITENDSEDELTLLIASL
jgi:tetratricopeptide (TPR) repeat protein